MLIKYIFQVDVGGRSKVRSKIRFDDTVEEQPEAETQPPPTAGRGRTRSRFGGTRTRTPTGACGNSHIFIFVSFRISVPFKCKLSPSCL